jgi:hypothetical protein
MKLVRKNNTQTNETQTQYKTDIEMAILQSPNKNTNTVHNMIIE